MNKKSKIALPAIFAAAIIFTASCIGTAPTEGAASPNRFSDGIYEGSARGYRGFIYVLVRIEGGRIAEIEVISSDEDRFVGGEAIDELLDLVIEFNTLDLDVVSGATISSTGFLQAVENAIFNR